MKNCLLKGGLLLLICLIGPRAIAQTSELTLQADSTAVQPKSYEVYCEIVSYSSGLFTNKVSVNIDFGQYARFFSRDRRLVDADGNNLVFNSALDAANYMAERGWVFKQAYVTQNITKGDSQTAYTHWILAKTISSPEQIYEGLRTYGMNR